MAEQRSLSTILQVLKSPDVRARLAFTLFILIVYRFLASVPLPGIDVTQLSEISGDSPLDNVFTLVTGGQLDSPTIVAIGIAAYINASIIIQLLSSIVPKLEELRKEGERGRMVINQYTRYLTLPISLIQSYGIYIILKERFPDLIGTPTPLEIATIIATLTAGSITLMWLAELMSEKGVGNGASFIIFAGIVSSLPSLVSSDIDLLRQSGNLNLIVSLIVGLLILVFVIVHINEAIRKIPIQYARRVRGNKLAGGGSSYLPLKVNSAGVMPLIFAFSIIFFLQFLADFFQGSAEVGSQVYTYAAKISEFFTNQDYVWIYNTVYFLIIVVFTFYYTFMVIKPEDTAENLRKSGGFVPGIRPGKSTEIYVRDILIRLTVLGAIFLGFIAIVPSFARTQVQLAVLSGLGGTSILIIVGVLLDSYRQVKSMMVTRSYEAYE